MSPFIILSLATGHENVLVYIQVAVVQLNCATMIMIIPNLAAESGRQSQFQNIKCTYKHLYCVSFKIIELQVASVVKACCCFQIRYIFIRFDAGKFGLLL